MLLLVTIRLLGFTASEYYLQRHKQERTAAGVTFPDVKSKRLASVAGGAQVFEEYSIFNAPGVGIFEGVTFDPFAGFQCFHKSGNPEVLRGLAERQTPAS